MTDVIPHPHRDLMAEAKHEREVADSPEAEKLKDAIVTAVAAYSDFLEQKGVIWDDDADPDDLPRLKVEGMVITVDYGEHYGTIHITLKNGACDRVYGNGVNKAAALPTFHTSVGRMIDVRPARDNTVHRTPAPRSGN
jgi:hypothetical protein